jgi:hypothetical protein
LNEIAPPGQLKRSTPSMKVENRRFLRIIRIVEFVSGLGVLLLGLWMWFLTTGYELIPPDPLMLLVCAGPGATVAVGASLQTLFHKTWGLALVVVGAVATLFIGIQAFLFVRYLGDNVWMSSLSADISLVVITLIASVMLARKRS